MSSSTKGGSGTHMPSCMPVFAIEQASHAWSHAMSQHTPSAQKPLVQSAAPAHGCPWSFLQLPIPSHELTPVHAFMGLSSSVSTGTFVHVPTLPLRLHALHAAVHVPS